MIRARAWSDDHNVDVAFDATPYFQQASILDILHLASCGWSRDYPADAVAMYMADQPASDGQEGHPGLHGLFQYLEIIAKDPMKKDCRGFECEIDRQDVLDWVGIHRPQLSQAIGHVEERGTSPEEALRTLPKKRFRVQLARTETRRLETLLDAVDAGHAQIEALDRAGDMDFTTGTSGEPEYIVEMTEALGSNDDDRAASASGTERNTP